MLVLTAIFQRGIDPGMVLRLAKSYVRQPAVTRFKNGYVGLQSPTFARATACQLRELALDNGLPLVAVKELPRFGGARG